MLKDVPSQQKRAPRKGSKNSLLFPSPARDIQSVWVLSIFPNLAIFSERFWKNFFWSEFINVL